jgi:hypothetical protein
MSKIATIAFGGTVDPGLLRMAFYNGDVKRIKQLSPLTTTKLQKQHLKGSSKAEPLVFWVNGKEVQHITYYVSELGDVFCFSDSADKNHYDFISYLDGFNSPEDSVVKPTYPCLEIL